MMSKGGSSTTSVKIPAWLEDAAKEGVARAKQTANIGYTPYYGPDVAAMTPQQIAAMQGTNQMASAFGMPTADVTAGMPTATNYGGMSAYSSGGMYDQALAELKARQPGQYAAISNLFIDPVTGQLSSGGSSSSAAGAAAAAAPATVAAERRTGQDRGNVSYGNAGGSGGRSTTSMDTLSAFAPGGVRTRNPANPLNQAIASLTSRPQSAPTAANRPVSRSSASGGGASGGGGGK